MTTPRTLLWIERIIWILIYGGLLALVLGLASLSANAAAAWSLMSIGGAVAAAGVILIWVRSRLDGGS
jgi:hypothetical protein